MRETLNNPTPPQVNTVFRQTPKTVNVPKGTKKINVFDHLDQANGEIRRLKCALAEKEEIVGSLRSTIRSFTSLAVDQYKLSLQNLYTRVEFIVKGEAANMNNDSRGNLRKMQAAIQKMKLFTEDIIQISQIYISENTSQEVDLQQIFRIAKKNQKDKTDEYDFQVSCEKLPTITGCPLLLVKLFDHMIDNAIRLRNISRPCKLVISSDCICEYDEKYGTERTFHRVSFSDNGTGFVEADKDNLFNMLHYMTNKEKYKTAGLNLPASKRIMDMHFGHITAEKGPEGEVFHCYFPTEKFSEA